MTGNFAGGPAGFLTAKTPTDRSYTPRPERDENMLVARFGNLLARYTGNEDYRKMAERAMRYLVTPEIAKLLPTGLLANLEFAGDPIHITIVGHKDDPAAQALFHAGAAYPSGYLRVEWWNANEGTPAECGRPISDVEISGGVHLHRQHVLFSHLQSGVDSHQSRQTNRVTPGRTRSCVPWQLSCEQAGDSTSSVHAVVEHGPLEWVRTDSAGRRAAGVPVSGDAARMSARATCFYEVAARRAMRGSSSNLTYAKWLDSLRRIRCRLCASISDIEKTKPSWAGSY